MNNDRIFLRIVLFFLMGLLAAAGIIFKKLYLVAFSAGGIFGIIKGIKEDKK